MRKTTRIPWLAYVAKLLANRRITRWLTNDRLEDRSEFQKIAEIDTIAPMAEMSDNRLSMPE